MNQKSIYLIIVIVMLLTAIAYLPARINLPVTPEPVSVPPVVESKTTVTMGLGDTATVNGNTLKAMHVFEDSRCPSDVQCIQAGRVVVAISVESPSGLSTYELPLGQTYTTEALEITLDEVTPYPISTHKTTDEEYSFTFTIVPHDAGTR
jgi:hypothetical protein